jgi:hypothetical protein
MLERYRPEVAAGCLVWLMWAGSSCQGNETRPAMVGDCNDPACLDSPGLVPTPIGSGQSGQAGAAGGNGMPDPTAGSLTGNVLEIVNADLVTSGPLSISGSVEVRAANALPGADDVVVVPAADGSFTLDDIERGSTVWVGVGAFDEPPGEPFIDTLQAADSSRMGVRDLLVVRRELLRELAAESFINNPTELDPDRAHLILQFVDEDGGLVEGVQVTFPAPEDVSTAYDAGPIYSDALAQTSTRGTAVLLNITAPDYPGTALTIIATLDGERFTAPVQVARRAVTIVTAVVPD